MANERERAEQILRFWFGAGTPEDRARWFAQDAVFDSQVRARFGLDYEAGRTGRLANWRARARSCLALVIVLDQFPRNMFRGSARAFESDAMAVAVAQQAIENDFQNQLVPIERVFLYLPFAHSEDLEQQERSLKLFEQLAAEPGMDGYLNHARRHHEVIARFGRFPHRNALLGRVSTGKEKDFLLQPGSRF